MPLTGDLPADAATLAGILGCGVTVAADGSVLLCPGGVSASDGPTARKPMVEASDRRAVARVLLTIPRGGTVGEVASVLEEFGGLEADPERSWGQRVQAAFEADESHPEPVFARSGDRYLVVGNPEEDLA